MEGVGKRPGRHGARLENHFSYQVARSSELPDMRSDFLNGPRDVPGPPDPHRLLQGSPHWRIIIYIPKMTGLGHRIGHHMRGGLLISEGGIGVFMTKWRTTEALFKKWVVRNLEGGRALKYA